jgi:hypothetical protein
MVHFFLFLHEFYHEYFLQEQDPRLLREVGDLKLSNLGKLG